jgi:hypothetical protein
MNAGQRRILPVFPEIWRKWKCPAISIALFRNETVFTMIISSVFLGGVDLPN